MSGGSFCRRPLSMLCLLLLCMLRSEGTQLRLAAVSLHLLLLWLL